MADNDEIYTDLIQKKGLAYLDSQIKDPDKTHYRDPIDNSPGRLAGNSHIWGDASPEVQSRAIDAIIQASQKAGLNQHETAYVLAMGRAESGFNPDAAAGTTTAYGLGQFVDGTAKGYAITDANRGDLTKQAEALVATYKDDAALAKSRGKGEEYIYKYHHDGPSAEFGGLELSQKHIMPYVPAYEKFVQDYEKKNPVLPADPDFDKRNHADVSTPAHHGHAHASGLLQRGDKGDAVGEVQTELRDLGYKDHKGDLITPDKSYGNDTKAAVAAFQKDHGLDIDGVAGPTTQKALKDQVEAKSNAQSAFTDTAKAYLLSDAAHPGNGLYMQAYGKLADLDTQIGRTSDQRTANLAGAATVAALGAGIGQIDYLLPDMKDGSTMFVAQNTSPLKTVAEVPTMQGMNTPLEQSSAQFQQVTQQQAQVQLQTQQQTQVQGQDMTQQQAQPAMQIQMKLPGQ
ncbi:hypothetical protein DIE11_17210 [Burkholderia sp. Bp9012]|uniref:phage tail tip lysozyme n=1 Tax=Burkholderia sp. Bp9012 TaxID=2184562 RepID=UPI000F5A819E|nr:phage tail tip lysozyme [Burkholderia sp. Bp9012]RQR79139.1 hypothetical protein DIE11_17210 [Burkholderia sp. Bp9012]